MRAYRETSEPPMTLAALAGEIGVKPNTVWRWENGRMPRRSEWPKIEAATGIKASDLVEFQQGGA